MAWPTDTKTEDMFKPASAVAQHKTGLKVLAYGEPDTMKTGFALSFPAPIYIFDTESPLTCNALCLYIWSEEWNLADQIRQLNKRGRA